MVANPSVCLSVCASDSGIESERMHISSKLFPPPDSDMTLVFWRYCRHKIPLRSFQLLLGNSFSDFSAVYSLRRYKFEPEYGIFLLNSMSTNIAVTCENMPFLLSWKWWSKRDAWCGIISYKYYDVHVRKIRPGILMRDVFALNTHLEKDKVFQRRRTLSVITDTFRKLLSRREIRTPKLPQKQLTLISW